MRSRKTPGSLRSARWFAVDDLRSFGHRSRMKQIGYAVEEFQGKPIIGIINTWSDFPQCHAHLPSGYEPVSLAELGITQSFDQITPVVYRDGNNNYIVSFGGSNLPSVDEAFHDLRTDRALADGQTPEALIQAYEFFKLVQQGANDISPGEVGSFATIGHSLGGSEAIYDAARMQFETGQWVEGIGIDAAAFKPDIALPPTATSYFPNSLFNISAPGDAVTAVTAFQGETRGMIMPAEQVYLTPNPATQDQYGPTADAVKSACSGVGMECFTAVLQAHRLQDVIAIMKGHPDTKSGR